MKSQEQKDPTKIERHKTKTSKSRTMQIAYLWEFENFVKERLRALGIIQ